MNIINIELEEAKNYINRLEDHFFDQKSSSVKPTTIEKAAVAFANAEGGEILIGIEDQGNVQNLSETDRWLGFETLEDFNEIIASLFRLTPTLPITYSVLSCRSLPGYALKIEVEKSNSVHYTSANDVFVRLNAQSLKVSEPSKVQELIYAKGERSFEDQVLTEVRTEEVAESKVLKAFLQEALPHTDPLAFLIGQNMLDVKTWEPKAAAVLLFAEHPEVLMPKQCGIKVIRYETREEEPERDHLKDTFSYDGPLYDLIHKSVNKVKEIMSQTSVWTTEGLRAMEYPPETLWEVIVNAVIHRDYSISDNIQILIYDDRIEVKSPGRLPGNITVDNILESRFSRNPKIVRTLNRYKSPPNKDIGEGLNTAFQKMRDWKLKDPSIEVKGSYVSVEIPHTPLAAPEQLILDFLSKRSQITNRQARELTGIRSENSMKNCFYKLRDNGFIEQIPGLKGSASAWRIKQ